MRKTTYTIISSLALVGLAHAQAPKKEAAPPAKGAPATPATPATPAAPAKDAKAPAAAPAKWEAPKPAPELTAVQKMLAGTWKCTGKMMDPMNPGQMMDAKLTMTMKADLANFWIHTTMKAGGKMPWTATMLSSYDPHTKKWFRFMADSMGGSQQEWSDGMKDNKVVWTGEMKMPSPDPKMSTAKVRTTENIVGPKQVDMTGEVTMDGGKTWMTGWRASCKK